MMVSKYKSGDKARVKYGLVAGQTYGGLIATGGMVENRGNIFTIDGVYSGDYTVKENKYYWSEEMLEPVAQEWPEVGDTVTVQFTGKVSRIIGRAVTIEYGDCIGIYSKEDIIKIEKKPKMARYEFPMPKNCFRCNIADSCEFEGCDDQERPDDCPLKEVNP